MTTTWSATGTRDGIPWHLDWSPTAPHLSGTSPMVDAVVEYLDDRDRVRLTPTSASVPAEVSNPEAVAAAIVALGHVLTLTGDAPTPARVPNGAVA